MADRSKQFSGSNSPQDLGDPDAGIAEADRDANGWDLRSLEDVRAKEETAATDESGRRRDKAEEHAPHGEAAERDVPGDAGEPA